MRPAVAALILAVAAGCSENAPVEPEQGRSPAPTTTGSVSGRATIPPPPGPVSGTAGETISMEGAEIRVIRHFFDPCQGATFEAPPLHTYLVVEVELANHRDDSTLRYGALDFTLLANNDDRIGPELFTCHEDEENPPLRPGVRLRSTLAFKVDGDDQRFRLVWEPGVAHITIDLGE